MPIQFDPYDQMKVDSLKAALDASAEHGSPKSFEIHVDNVKAIHRTTDLNEFYKYENFMTPATSYIRFIFFCANNSPRNDQYVLTLKAQNSQEAMDKSLDGVAQQVFTKNELKDIIQKRNKANIDQQEVEALRNKIAEQEAIINDQNIQIDGLLKAHEQSRNKANVQLGNVLSLGLESLLIRNLPKLSKIEGFEGLAGFISENYPQQEEAPQQEPTHASFKRKETGQSSSTLSEEEKQFLTLFSQINMLFNQAERDQLMQILGLLHKDKTQLIPVMELLQEQD